MSREVTKQELCQLAKKAQERSYSPYSGFSVGAALLCADGSVYLGSNIENSSYSATVCAERVAFFNAVNDGKRDFIAVAIVGGKDENSFEICPPCGVCRQVMSEFCNPEIFKIYLPENDNIKEYYLNDLLPLSFKL